MINLDHAATTPLRPEALNAMLPYFTEHAANANALYAEGRRARAAIDAARRQIADAIHAKPAEIYFTGSGSEADNWALFGAMRAMAEKSHIVTTQVEHHAILNACAALEKLGYEVSYVPVDRQGCVDPEAIENAVRPETGMVSVMLANNEVGTIQPISEIAKVAHMHGALMHTDAVQAVGHIPVDVEALDVDLLSLSAHKFYGPKGIGALYIRNGVKMTNLIYGGEQERGLRAGTENTPAIVGMGKALSLSCAELEQTAERIRALRNLLEGEITRRFPNAIVNGDRENRLPGTLHVTFPGE
ncbi:MAG: cysteine desulfurase family protein [Christensenellales bacterium]